MKEARNQTARTSVPAHCGYHVLWRLITASMVLKSFLFTYLKYLGKVARYLSKHTNFSCLGIHF